MGTDKDTRTTLFKDSANDKSYTIRKSTFEDLELVKKVNEKELPED